MAKEEIELLHTVIPVEEDKPTDNITKDPIAMTLLSAVRNNNKQEIENIFDNAEFQTNLIKYRYENELTIFGVACDDNQIDAHTLHLLYSRLKLKYGQWTDDLWYGWEAIHYLAFAGNPEKLRLVISEMDDVDGLTYFSENALHILMEHGKSTRDNLVLYKGSESKTCSVTVVEDDEIIKCAEILIKKGIDVNHSNFWNDTPICLAVKYHHFKFVDVLLRAPNIDVANCKISGISVKDFLKLHNISIGYIPPTDFYHENPVTILFNYLKSGNEDEFVCFSNQILKNYVNSLDGDKNDNASVTMLQFCLRKGFLAYLKDDRYQTDLTVYDILNTPMMDIFITKGLGRCIEHLLNNGADLKKVTKKFETPLLEAAALKGYYPFVAYLLQHKKTHICTDDIFEILPKMFEDPTMLKNKEIYRNFVLYLLLNKLIENRNDDEFFTPKKRQILTNILIKLNLEQDENKSDDSDVICQILKLGGSLTFGDKENEIVVNRMHKNILKCHLDDCVDGHLYYNSLITDENLKYSETEVLRYLSKDNIKGELLSHPLMVTFIYEKWMKIYKYFIILLVLYGAFVFTIYLYILTNHVGYFNIMIDITFYILLGFQIVKEFIQFKVLYGFRKYFLSIPNYPELVVIISCVIHKIYPNVYCSVIAVLFSTTIFFILIGQLPIFTKYTLIWNSINYFIKYAIFYLFMFVSFAVCFYLIYPYNDTNTLRDNSTIYEELPKSLFDTLIIFTGEFNDRVLKPEIYPFFGRVIMALFIFCMTIILNNLLVGMIVADMDKIKSELILYKQYKMVTFIIRTNSFAERLHEWKKYDILKSFLYHINLFQKGKCKRIGKNNIRINLIKDFKQIVRNNLSNSAYDKFALKKVYENLRNNINGNRVNPFNV